MRRSLASPRQKAPVEKLTSQERSKRYIEQLSVKMLDEFQSGKIQVNKKIKPYLSERQKEQFQDRVYKKILSSKKKAEQKLQKIENDQRQYIFKHGTKNDVKPSISRVKSEVTQEEIENIRKIRKAKKQFEKKLQNRIRQFEAAKERKKQEENAERQKLLKERNDKKKEQIKKRLQQIQKNGVQREKRIQEEKQQIEKLKSKKKLFEMLDQNWKEKNSQEESKKWQELQYRLKNKQIDLSNLKEHQQKYSRILSQKKKELHKKRRQLSRSYHQNDIQHSKFYNSIVEQDEKLKDLEEEKRQAKKQFRNKIVQYADYVKNEHQPKVRVNSENSQDKQQLKIPRITKEQQNKQGLNYLEFGKSKAKKKQLRTIDFVDDKTKSQTKMTSKYKDYLTQTRKQRQKSKYSADFYKTPLTQAEKIMRNDKLERKQRIERMKQITDKIDKSTVDVVKKVAGKLQILQIMKE